MTPEEAMQQVKRAVAPPESPRSGTLPTATPDGVVVIESADELRKRLGRPVSAVREFIKHDQDKPATHLLPTVALESIALVLAYGAKKYCAHGWRTVDKRSRYYGAILRHAFAWHRGERLDPESGLPHLAHLACSALFLLEAELSGLGEDDRPLDKKS